MINFSEERYDKIKKDSDLWWEKKLNRPLIQVTLNDNSEFTVGSQFNYYDEHFDFDIAPCKVVDMWERNLSKKEYLGDGFPYFQPNFGPGLLAGLMGCEFKYQKGITAWFEPIEEKEIEDLVFSFDEENIILKRIVEILKIATKRFGKLVKFGVPDLGGCIDVLATYRGNEGLVYDMYDKPEIVKEKLSQLIEVWLQYFDYLSEIVKHDSYNNSCWCEIYSSKPYYMLQCDFSYMVGSNIFEEFCKFELEEMTKRIPNSFYHLDGTGELTHLDTILGLKNLDGIQWVPGANGGDRYEWGELYKKIYDSGKLIQLYAYEQWGQSCDILDSVVHDIGSLKNIVLLVESDIKNKEKIIEFLEKYNAT